jgi:hypothetical protein
MMAETWTLSCVFDTVALVGVTLKSEDYDMWNSQEKLEMGVYYTDEKCIGVDFVD